jgi:hypothetical protein
MLPAQEFANAFSMVCPAIVTLWCALVYKHTLVTALLVGTLMHLPVSFAYHLFAALQRLPDRLDNDFRRLDQTLQHVACVIFAYATTGLVHYALACSFFNALGVFMLWHPKTSNDGRRWIPIIMCVHLYMIPMLWRGDGTNFAVAFESMWIGGVFFVPFINYDFFHGWGHCVFHLALCVHSYALAESASLIAP